MAFLDEDFLLHSESARTLYNEYSKDEPIFDYHCHLPPEDVARNRRFSNLYEIWLEGDHYKWRAMRSDGVSEDLCTGDADPYEKYLAWCRTVPNTLRNPLYHWSHLELKRYFGIEGILINEDTAKEIWDEANRKLKDDALSAHGILENFKVRMIGTTDDPTDDLQHHVAISKLGIATKVAPTFRPDKALNVDVPSAFGDWLTKLEASTGSSINNFDAFIDALKSRHDFFHAVGGRLSDHGLPRCYYATTTKSEVAAIFDKARSGAAANESEKEAFAFYVMREVARWNAVKGWTMQLHVGPIRNNSTRIFNTVGPDAGTDSIGDYLQVEKMSRFLDSLDVTNELPKTILYNLNWTDNYAMASMIGNFQDGTIPGKIQFGSGWWFSDQKEGMIAQMNALSSLGLLSRFVGMLTDSRSFLSYPRHEYFRRILCNLVGEDIENGELPKDYDLVGQMVRNISFGNAAGYFGIDV